MARLLTLEGVQQQFVIGLTWRHEDAPPRPAVLRAMGREKGRWAVVRRTSAGTLQAGFCRPIPKTSSPRRLRALAAIVADNRPQPWRGVYRIGPELYWYIAVRDGQEVMPDGDQVGTLEQVRQWLDRDYDYGNWTEVEGTLDDLADIVRGAPPAPALQDTEGRTWVLPAAGAAGAVVLLAGGWLAWTLYEDSAQRQSMPVQRLRTPPVSMSAAPVDVRVAPSVMTDACARAWGEQSLARGGWLLSGWSCRRDRAHGGLIVATDWQRGGGKAAAPGAMDADGEHAHAEQFLALTPPAAPADSAAAAVPVAASVAGGDSNDVVWSLAHRYAMHVQPEGGGPGGGAAGVVLSADAPLWRGLGPAFDAARGLRIEEISWIAPSNWAVLVRIDAAHAPPRMKR